MLQRDGQLYEFGGFCLDSRKRILLRAGVIVPVTPKAVDLLVALVENQGQVLSKDELMQLVWPDTFVEEANLSHHIFSLRKALGEEKSGVKFIETIPRRGYRFVASVTPVEVELDELFVAEHTRERVVIEQSETLETATGESETGQVDLIGVREKGASSGARIRNYAVLFTLVCVATAIIVAVYFWTKAGSGAGEAVGGRAVGLKSIAVLPFKLISAGAEDEYLGFGMADALIVRFSRLKKITVRPTNAVTGYREAGQDPVLAGRALKVDSVLDGSIQRLGDRIRVTVYLVRVADGAHLWADKFDGKLTDLFALQDRASDKVAAALELELSSAEKMQLLKRYTEDSEAYRLYLKGGYYWNKWTPEGWEKAIEYFSQAIEKDPEYAPAYGWLGAAYQVQGNNGVLNTHEASAKARQFAAKALKIDDDVDQGHFTMGAINLFYDWNWIGAEKELRRGIDLNPNYVEGRILYVYYLLITGETDEAIAEAKRCEELNPVSPFVGMNLADMLNLARRYDEAIAQYRKTLDLDPHYVPAYFSLGGAYLEKGMSEQAMAEMNKGLDLIGGDREASPLLGYLYARTGQPAKARAQLERLEKEASGASHPDPMLISYIYTALGEKDRAFEWLEKAYVERNSSLIWINIEARLDPLRADPRFTSLRRRVGL